MSGTKLNVAYVIAPNRRSVSGIGLIKVGQVWTDTVRYCYCSLTDLADLTTDERNDGSSRFSDRVRISDQLTTSFNRCFFLEVTYPHPRVVLIRAAVKDP